jgi:hypothetical protein
MIRRALPLGTDPELVAHPVARETLLILRDLRRVRATVPALLIAEAIERLSGRAILAARNRDQASRALANLDAVVERARAHGVQGFRQFAMELNAEWSNGAAQPERTALLLNLLRLMVCKWRSAMRPTRNDKTLFAQLQLRPKQVLAPALRLFP